MAIYQLKTFDDLVDAVREALGIQDTDTPAINKIKRDINMVYVNEVVPYQPWKWLRKSTDLYLDAVYTSGTATVSSNSVTVTMSTALSPSKKGYFFAADGYNEIYRIEQHTAGSTTVTLSSPYTGTTNTTATFKIWTDGIPLPVNCRETQQVMHDFQQLPMEGKGLQEFRRYTVTSPKAEGRPRFYTTDDYIDPAPYTAIAGFPASTTRGSEGLVKTLVFGSSVASHLEEGDRIEISGASHYSYNGEFTVASVSTTTITFMGKVDYYEATSADTGVTIKLLDNERDAQRLRMLRVYPSIFSSRVTLHVDWIEDTQALEDDDDEPLMPVSDRNVLLYGALMYGWSRARNEEQATRNGMLYDRKLKSMEGHLDDSTDLPKIIPGKTYIAAKRRPTRGFQRGWGWDNAGSGSGGASATTVTGTGGFVAVFDGTGVLTADTIITTVELQLLNGLTTAVVGKGDTQTLTNKSIDADTNTISNIGNADIKAGAAIDVSKLAALTVSRAVVTDSSGFVSASVITATEVTYLDDNEALTSVTLTDNTAAPAAVATWAHASFTSVQLDFSLARGVGKRESGTLYIVTDGTTIALATAGVSFGALGVTFTADISGANARLLYTTTSTGTNVTMKYKAQKWLA